MFRLFALIALVSLDFAALAPARAQTQPAEQPAEQPDPLMESWRINVEIDRHALQISDELSRQAGLRVATTGLVCTSAHTGLGECDLSVTSSAYDFQTTVALRGVRMSNLRGKVDEAIALVAADYRAHRARARSALNFGAASMAAASHQYGTAQQGAIQFGFGSVPFASGWVQIDGIPRDGSASSSTHWLRTQLTIEGTATPPAAGTTQHLIQIMRLNTSIWSSTLEGNGGGRTVRMTVRAGVLDGALRIENGSAQGRFDIDAVRLVTTQIWGAGSDFAYYINQAFRLGMRIADRGAAQIRAVMGLQGDLGFLIGNRFFVQAGGGVETDWGNNQRAFVNGGIGWRIDGFRVISGTLNYEAPFTNAAGADVRDNLLVIPPGWSFMVTAQTGF